MRRNYEPAPKSFGGTVLLIVLGLIALPAAVHALVALIPILIILGVLSVIGGLLIGRKNYF